MKDFKFKQEKKGGICSCCSKKEKKPDEEKESDEVKDEDAKKYMPPKPVEEKIFWDKLVISQDNQFIIFFNIFIIALNIVSSYIYFYFTAFR